MKYGEISRRAGAALSDTDVASYFAKLIMSCVVSVTQLAQVGLKPNELLHFAHDDPK